MKIRIVSATHVERLLSMTQAVELMRTAFAQLSAGQVQMPLRPHVNTPDGTSLVMPAYLEQTGDLCVKVVSVYNDNPKRYLPVITGVVLVLDPQTGLPKALLDGHGLTSIRTGAVGGLAADLFARKDAQTVVLIGAGEQGRWQLQGLSEVRPIRRVYLVDRARSAADRLAGEIARWPDPPAVEIVDDPREAVPRADVVIAATTSSVPVFDGGDLQRGTHVTAVGSYQPETREVDQVTVERSRVIVDSRSAALVEAGDLNSLNETDVIELGEVVNGQQPARQNDDEITFFKSVGVAVQDAVAARVVADRAEELEVGTVVDL